MEENSKSDLSIIHHSSIKSIVKKALDGMDKKQIERLEDTIVYDEKKGILANALDTINTYTSCTSYIKLLVSVYGEKTVDDMINDPHLVELIKNYALSKGTSDSTRIQS